MRFAVALLAFALAGCASGSTRYDRYARLLTPTANPSKVVATELAFARAAQEKGQWTAFREFATDDAVMFVPGPVKAQEWLKKQSDPAQAVTWQPHEVWSSCDGSMAVTKGAWQRGNGTSGYFTTVWQRQHNGEYKWVLDQGDVLTTPLVEPEFIRTAVAACVQPEAADGVTFGSKPMASRGGGGSIDNTLSFAWVAYSDGSRELSVSMMSGNAMKEVLNAKVAAASQ